MDPEFSQFLAGIAASCNFAEGGTGVKKILVEIYRHGKISVRDLARVTRIAPPVISFIINKLVDGGLLFRDKNGVGYNEGGMRYVENRAGIRSLSSVDCEHCGASTIDINLPSHDLIYNELELIAGSRPPADVSLDQAKCTAETILRRLLLLHRWHAFDGTRIAFLGDDDFMSVACHVSSFVGGYFIPEDKLKIPFSVSVLDIDQRILDTIKTDLSKRGARSPCIVLYDARDPLPSDLLHLHDVVFMDPPYTLNGFKLFFSRGVSLLKKVPGSKIFLSFGHVPLPVLHEIQHVITTSGFLIEEILPAFNEYEGGNTIGNISQMLVLTAMKEIFSPFDHESRYSKKFYTADF
ncbi:MAG: bis-aminopropyl spermidine synthase family protein [Promethearchaeota archaeon]